jgi:hypothetical protein
VNSNRLFKTATLLVGVIALMALAAPAAFAQSASQNGYEGEAPLTEVDAIGPQGGGDDSPPAAQVVSGSDDSGALPFTGWDVGIVAVLGLALAATGLAVRRAARSPGS